MKRSLYRSRDSFATVSFDMVEVLGGDVLAATLFDWIVWKNDPRYDGVVDDTGRCWFPMPLKEISAHLRITEKQVRSALEKLVALGHLSKTQLRLGGAWDKTLAYAPVWEENPLPSGAHRTAPEGKCSSAPEGTSSFSNEIEDSLHIIDVQSGSIDDLFSQFWKAWPKKVAKGQAQKAFRAALRKVPAHRRESFTNEIIAGIARSMEVYRREGRDEQKIPYPATWLSAMSWEDQYDVPAATAGLAYDTTKEFNPDDFLR